MWITGRYKSMKTLYIVGTAGSARDCANYALDAGFLLGAFVEQDDRIEVPELMIRGERVPVIAETAFLAGLRPGSKPAVLVPIGMPAILERVVGKYEGLCEFPNLIHPSALIADTSVTMGHGNIIGPNCVLTTSIAIGDFNFMNIGVTLGHDVRAGSFNIFNPKASVSGNVHIGNGNTFGANSSVLQGLRVGDRNTLGMGGALLKDAGDGGVFLGVPARQIS